MQAPAWSGPVSVGAPAGLYNITAFTPLGDRLYASSNGGGVALYEPNKKAWRTLITDDAAAKGLAERLGMQHRFGGPGDGLWGLCVPSGRMVALNQDTGAWGVMGEGDAKLKLSWALCAYDPSRDIVVVWGPQKSDGTRSDATLVWHGGWHKPKKSTTASKEDLACDSGAFCLVYSKRHGGVVRIGTTEAAVFDGKGWQPLRFTGQTLLHSWERAPFVCGDTAVLVQRFANDPSVVRVVGDAKTVAIEPVCVLPSFVQRKGSDSGGNVVVDVVSVDARGVFVGYDEKKKTLGTLELGSLLG
jgi:hypothetical protein